MSFGVFLTSFGKSEYIKWAYNMAYSIKHFAPEIKICLFHDEAIEQIVPEKKDIFDFKIEIPTSIKFHGGKIDPAFIKTSVYPYLPFEHNLILDVDGIAMQDITPLFELLAKGKDYYTAPLYGSRTYNDPSETPRHYWAKAEEVWEKYKLKTTDILPSVNSSFQYVRKCKESEDLFSLIQKNLADPIPIEKLIDQWGGCQPDELYVNVTLAQKGILPSAGTNYMFFGRRFDPSIKLTEIEQRYYFLSVYGGKNFTSPVYTELYDRILQRMMKGVQRHNYEYHKLANSKHAGIRPRQEAKVKQVDDVLKPGLIPIAGTTLIDHTKLIQRYKNSDNRTDLKVSNWLNCSFIQYKDKNYFAYRMEMRPYCTRMKIAMCLLDTNLQPIPETNVLLELHSSLRGFPKGFHVEDPRLFIHNDELYISYTDGYQMGQAKINPQTLQASESFYIDLPVVKRTEKNWTFFSHDKKLYSVYDIPSHTIFEMRGSKFEKVYSTDYQSGWNYGEIRGGTSPVRIGNKYLAFFHSATPIKYKGYNGRQYFMGAYTFEAEAPFRPIAISKEPIIAGELTGDSIPRLSNKIFVVFPSGVIRKDNTWLVSFGYNDTFCRYVEVTDALLKENMVEVKIKEGVEVWA